MVQKCKLIDNEFKLINVLLLVEVHFDASKPPEADFNCFLRLIGAAITVHLMLYVKRFE